MKQNNETYIYKAEREWDEVRALARRRPMLFTCFLLLFLLGAAVLAYDRLWGIPKIREELASKNAEIQRLEIQLAPFRTVALRWYSGPEAEAMAILASKISHLEKELVGLIEYSEVATWRFDGGKSVGSGVAVSGPVGNWHQGYVNKHGEKISWNCHEEALDHYKTVIEKHPRYPFPYYMLAACLTNQGDDSWEIYANAGISILEHTTNIPGHDPDHDDVLKRLRAMIGGNK